MEAIDLIFWILALVTCGSAVVVALSPKLIHSVFALFFALLGVAGLYAALGADFLAAAQVIVYIGGILVLLIFGVMLTNRIGQSHLPNELTHGVSGSILAALVLVAVLRFAGAWRDSGDPAWARTYRSDEVSQLAKTERIPAVKNTTMTLGVHLLTTYVVPFEVASVVLLVAMIGAASIARKEVD
ncbi:MAG: NADH-quinone oxidoreductase subunit J [Candidatus Riflebacteria bacterium]|nr:NADH-quinone oxidoreductase subunit J [Candidatus Riflebacteria bacterium]